MNRVFRQTVTQTIAVVEMGVHIGISQSYGGSFRDEWANTLKITKLKKTRYNYCTDVLVDG